MYILLAFNVAPQVLHLEHGTRTNVLRKMRVKGMNAELRGGGDKNEESEDPIKKRTGGKG